MQQELEDADYPAQEARVQQLYTERVRDLREVGKRSLEGGSHAAKAVGHGAMTLQEAQIVGGVFAVAKRLGMRRLEGESMLMFQARVSRQLADNAKRKVPRRTDELVRYDPVFAAHQILGRPPFTPGGRVITDHAARRIVNPGPGRVPMTLEEVDAVLDYGTKIRKVSPHPLGDTVTVQHLGLPGKPQVVVDAATGRRVITVIKNN